MSQELPSPLSELGDIEMLLGDNFVTNVAVRSEGEVRNMAGHMLLLTGIRECQVRFESVKSC